MPDAILYTEIVVGVLVTLVVLFLTATSVRRRVISSGAVVRFCGLRTSGSPRWRVGLMKFGPRALEWYPLGGFSVRATHSWDRRGLLLEAPRELGRTERIARIPGAVGVAAVAGGQSFELAVNRPAYTALRSWQEASPPGYDISHVA